MHIIPFIQWIFDIIYNLLYNTLVGYSNVKSKRSIIKGMNRNKKGAIAVAVALLTMTCTSCGIGGEKFNVDEQLAAGQSSLYSKDYYQAVSTFTGIITEEPTNVLARQGLIDSYIGNGDLDGAITAYEDTKSVAGITGLSLDITLPYTINVSGGLRTIDIYQAKAFASTIRDENPDYVTFFDADGTLAMVTGTRNFYSLDGMSIYYNVVANLYTWNGSYAQDCGRIFSLYNLNGKNFVCNGTDTTMFQGADTAYYYYYGFNNGNMSSVPEYMSISLWYKSYFEKYADEYAMDMMTTMGNFDQFIEHMEVSGDAGSSLWKDGEWKYIDFNTGNADEVYGDLTQIWRFNDEECWSAAGDFLKVVEGSNSVYSSLTYPAYRYIINSVQNNVDIQNSYKENEYEKSSVSYMLLDLDNDGKPELLINRITEGWYDCSIYRERDEDQKVDKLGTINFGAASVGGSRGSVSLPADGNGIYQTSFHSLSPDMNHTLYTIDKFSLSKVTVDNIDDSTPIEYDQWFDATDMSGLRW